MKKSGPRKVDNDLEKIRRYLRKSKVSLRIVKVKHSNSFYEAYYVNKPKPRIVVYAEPTASEDTIVLRLLHEIGHHLDSLHSANDFLKNEVEVLNLDEQGEKLSKQQREIIWASEVRGTSYMEFVAVELALSIPLYKVKAEAEYDRWAAWTFFVTGSFPTSRMHQKYVTAMREVFRDEE